MRQIEKTSSLTVDSYRLYLSNTSLLSDAEQQALFSSEIQDYSISLLIEGLRKKAIQTQIDYYKNLWLNTTNEDLQANYQSVWQELLAVN
jgi:hypothetical protein